MLGCKGQILEDKQQQHMKRNPGGQNSLLKAVVQGLLHAPADVPSHQDGKHHQEHEKRLAPGIKGQAGKQKKDIAELSALDEGIIVNEQSQGEKKEEEYGR